MLSFASALEQIDFQSGKYFKELTEAIAACQDYCKIHGVSGYFNLIATEPAEKILAVIKKYSNQTLFYSTEYADAGPAISSTAIWADHIFWPNEYREYAEFYQWFKSFAHEHRKKVISGKISLSQARIEGDIADLKNELYMPNCFFTGNPWYGAQLTPAEWASIVLHEQGHSFTFLEFLTRTSSSNLVLDYLSKRRAGANAEEYKIAITGIRKVDDLSEDQEKALAQAKSDEDMALIYVAFVRQKIQSELGVDFYDSTACEQSADAYATRQGAGLEVMTALEKVGGLQTYKNRHKYSWIGEGVLSTLGLTLLAIFSPVGFALIGVFIVLPQILFALNRHLFRDLYDDGLYRPIRVKQELVTRLKDKTITPQDRKVILGAIAGLDTIISSKPYEDTFLDKISLLFNSKYKKVIGFQNLQKELESLASNNLYVKAAQLQDTANN